MKLRNLLILALLAAPCSLLAAVDARCPHPHGQFASSAVASSGFLVCLVNPEEAGKYELFSVNPSGVSTKLSQSVSRPNPFDVILFAVSPDGARVAYTADALSWTKYELYAVPISGGHQVKLSGTLLLEHDVDDFRWTNDSARVVYRKGRNTVGKWDLWSVPISGGGVTGGVQLSQPGGQVAPGFQVVGGSVRYQFGNDGSFAWWRVPVAGGTPTLERSLLIDGFESGDTRNWR